MLAANVRDKKIPSGHRDAIRALNPEEIKAALIVAPEVVVFANGAVAKVRDKQIPSGHHDALRVTSTLKKLRRR